MTRKQFFKKLDHYLRNVPYSEKRDLFQYYEEYFDDLYLKDNDEIPANMDPYKIAKEILLETGFNNIKEKKKLSNPLGFILMVIGAIFSIPIALPLLIVVLSLIFVVFVLIIVIPIAIILFLISFIFNPLIIYNGYMLLGYILMLAGVIYLLKNIVVKVFKTVLNVIAKIFAYIYSKISGKNTKNTNDEKMNIKFIDLDNLSKIDISQFAGTITIKKSNENSCILKSDMIDKINTSFLNGVFKVSFDEGIIKYKEYRGTSLIISYTASNLSANVSNFAGPLNLETAISGNYNFSGLVSSLNIKVDPLSDISFKSSNHLGKLEIDNDIILSNFADISINADDIVGVINIRKGTL